MFTSQQEAVGARILNKNHPEIAREVQMPEPDGCIPRPEAWCLAPGGCFERGEGYVHTYRCRNRVAGYTEYNKCHRCGGSW